MMKRLAAGRATRAYLRTSAAPVAGGGWHVVPGDRVRNGTRQPWIRARPLSSPRERVLPGGLPLKPSLPTLVDHPRGAAGLSSPGPIYLGQRNSLTSLDFIDENRLLFTFRVPGVIHRELKPGETADNEERQSGP